VVWKVDGDCDCRSGGANLKKSILERMRELNEGYGAVKFVKSLRERASAGAFEVRS
jgi:hypothetical protein